MIKTILCVFILLLVGCGQSKEDLFFREAPDRLLFEFNGSSGEFRYKWPIKLTIEDSTRIHWIWHELQQLEKAPFAKTRSSVWQIEIKEWRENKQEYLCSLSYFTFTDNEFTFILNPSNKYKNDNLALFLKEELEVSFIEQLPINKDSDEWETIIGLLQDAVKHDREIVMPD